MEFWIGYGLGVLTGTIATIISRMYGESMKGSGVRED